MKVLNVKVVKNVRIVRNTLKLVTKNRFANSANINVRYVKVERMSIIIRVTLHVVVILVKIGMRVMMVQLFIGKLIDVLLAIHILIVINVVNNKEKKNYIFLTNRIIAMDVYQCANIVRKIKQHLEPYYVINV